MKEDNRCKNLYKDWKLRWCQLKKISVSYKGRTGSYKDKQNKCEHKQRG